MGRFVNPGNSAFQDVLNSKIYVDKTELLDYTNQAMDTTSKFICNSRPRRFGKSVTADMLTAYYSRGCDSSQMFSRLKIAEHEDYRMYMNRYDVIHFDVQWCMESAGGAGGVISYITENVMAELRNYYESDIPETARTLADTLSCINATTGRKFIIIIDEWDVLIRDEAMNQSAQDEYIRFLRGLFKGSEPSKFIHLAYLTGILPIKKVRTQSALNNFDEFTMLDAGVLAPFVGFTEDEVRKLCETYERDFSKAKCWYDGYRLDGYDVYNPKVIVSIMMRDRYKSYWSQTGSYDAIVPLINMDFDGLRTSIIEMLAGNPVAVDVSSFQNDAVSFVNKDDVITYLIHLGYLGYNQEQMTAFVPNEEIRQELTNATKRRTWNEYIEFQRSSELLLEATLNRQADVVAQQMERIHEEYASVVKYHDENSLSSVLSIAYLSSMQYYFKPVREMPTGRGFADFVFLPKPEFAVDYPALLVELKWNKSARTAIEQIKERNYPHAVSEYTGNILLVGINYDRDSKKHSCVIEEYKK